MRQGQNRARRDRVMNEDPLRIAVVSPFLDKRHGTERCVAEQVERLAGKYGYEVHLYCQRVEDIEGVERFRPGEGRRAGRIVWHRITDAPGPHLVKYLWWYYANQRERRRDSARGVKYDAVYSPGINCRDADAITVHIVFRELYERVGEELGLGNLPLRAWPRAVHRKLYYALIRALERRIYTNPRVQLAAVSGLTAREVKEHFGRKDVRVILNAVDQDRFNPSVRLSRRGEARRRFRYPDGDFVLLLMGNDWKKKGLDTLLEAVAMCSELPLRVLVAGRDDRGPYEAAIARLGLAGRVQFAEPSGDVVPFFAAADAYVGPSLHDSFALPPAEAMACGLPVVTSVMNGGAEVIVDGTDGFVLQDPRDPVELAAVLRKLFARGELRWQVGEKAARKAKQFGWDRNAQETHELLQEALRRKRAVAGVGAPQS